MFNNIENLFKDREAKIIGNYKKSAVMILINKDKNIVFEVRSNDLEHQPGDICFPGGRIEKGESPKEAAVREAMEELNLDRNDIELIGNMDYSLIPYHSIIYPFVGELKTNITNPSKSEVEEIFFVPLDYFLKNEPMLYEIEVGPNLQDNFPYHLIKGGKKYKFARARIPQYFYIYNDYVIWGNTALIVKSFSDIIKNEFKQ